MSRPRASGERARRIAAEGQAPQAIAPGLKLAVAQVLWCHGWFVVTTVAYVTAAAPFWVLGIWGVNVAMAWAKPVPHMPHLTLSIWGCVHWLRRYWREWRDG